MKLFPFIGVVLFAGCILTLTYQLWRTQQALCMSVPAAEYTSVCQALPEIQARSAQRRREGCVMFADACIVP